VTTDPFVQTFFEEAWDLLADAEAALVQLEREPHEKGLLDRIFRCAHTLKSNSTMLGYRQIGHFTHALEDLLEQLRRGTRAVTPPVIEALLAAQDAVRTLLAEARAGNLDDPPKHPPAIGQALTSIHRLLAETRQPTSAPEVAGAIPESKLGIPVLQDIAQQEIGSAHAEQSVEGFTPLLQSSGGSSAEAVSHSSGSDDSTNFAAGEHFRKRPADFGNGSSIRVRIERVDRLIDLVGELLITQSMVSQTVTGFTPEKLDNLKEIVAQIDRHVRELQERIMAVRMVPLKQALGRLPRLVRDLSATCGKQLTLEVTGEETELDKGVIEKISDPLTHLIRNAVDHGLETPQERRAAGKRPIGHIRIEAFQEGGSIFILVADDGRGIDVERVVSRAMERGLVAPGQDLTREEALALIFLPGVSTAEQVTEVSGRGVGMDIVRRNLESVGGSIAIFSEVGQGTRFRLKLPFTVAILDGQIVQVGDQIYLLPLLNILESVRTTPGTTHVIPGSGEVVVVRGKTVPLIRLHRLFGVGTPVTDPSQGLLVLTEHESHSAAMLVDEILGQQQVVIKSIETNFRKVEGIVGATILGNGRVALILDVPSLLQARRGRGRLPVAGILPSQAEEERAVLVASGGADGRL
jgi:two-component system chemotaxis sensor kinase CheA